MLVENSLDHKLFLISLLSTNESAKVAAKLIQDWKMDINNFPEVKERLMKASMRYYLGRFIYK